MSRQSAFLKGIKDDPENDEIRLVYADWLEEQGDTDRSEFIRAQVQLAKMEPWDEGYSLLDVRCRQLERAHPEWLGELEPYVERTERFCGDHRQPFHRGFLGRVELTPAQFVKMRQLAETPVCEFRFEVEGETGKFARVPEVSGLHAVEFAYIRDDASARTVLECLEHFTALQHFGLVGSTLTEPVAARIFAAPVLEGIRSLTIMGTRLPSSVEATFASRRWPNLRCLQRVWVSDLEWLASPWVTQLEKLTIHDNEPNLTPQQTQLLAEVLPSTAIRQMSLGRWALDVPGAQALSDAIANSAVRSLAVATTSLPQDVTHAFLTPTLVGALHALYLSWARLDAQVVARLLGSKLRVCALDHVTVAALDALEKMPGLPELEELRLGLVWRGSDDPFADRLRAVLEAGTLPKLASLTVIDTTPHSRKATSNWDQIVMQLANCPASAMLQELQLETLTGKGALALAASPYLDGLRLLNVRTWPQDKDAELALSQRFGKRVYLGIVSREF